MSSIRCCGNLLANKMLYFGRVGLSPWQKTVRNLAQQTHKSPEVEFALAMATEYRRERNNSIFNTSMAPNGGIN